MRILSFFASIGTLSAQAKKKAAPVARVKETPQMMADKVTIKRDIQLVDSLIMANQLEEEEDEFPADDLYSNWNNERVNPYGSVQIPDSFQIDVSDFYMPIEGRINSPFGMRKRRFHYGTDIDLSVGDTIRAAFDGKVRVKYYQSRGYGYYMVLRHPNGLETVYGHLSKFLIDLDESVKAGEPIALGGNTGRSTGPHLHFEMRFLGQAINPADIVDFKEFCSKDDYFVFRKNAPNNQYSSGAAKIVYHRIKSGDTLGSIARKHGVSVKQLCRLNNIKSNKTLKVGTTLRCS